MKITEYIKNNLLFFDGGMGTLLQKSGLTPGEMPENWNISHPETVTAIHKSYFDAGSNVVLTNTFGANLLKFDRETLEKTVSAAIENAKKARDESDFCGEKWIALDIGPSGRMLSPYGDFDFEDAVSIFAETVKLGEKYGADLIFIETMSDSYETKAAVLAAKENSSLPVFVSNAYSADGKLMTGANPEAVITMLEGLSVDAVGLNCSFGPEALKKVAEEYLKYSSLPVIFKPNAGMPKSADGKTVYDVSPEEFAVSVSEAVKAGISAVGGCCGTTPEYISALVSACKGIKHLPVTEKNTTRVSSYTHAVSFEASPVLIGERINPTGKKRFKEALKNNDIGYILNEGFTQKEKGVHILDVNVGIPEIDEKALLTSVVCELQAVIDLPLQIDSSDVSALESALRRYNGKAMINSVNGKKESMDAVFPLAKKYGGVVVALTLDENGIPETAEGRLNIAKKILKEAEKYGIKKKDLIFDPLAMTVSADKNAALNTLTAVRLITKTLDCKTSLGISNVSFGLPLRETVNASFFTMALENGLSAAIVNPNSEELMKAYYTYNLLSGKDENCSDFIAFSDNISNAAANTATKTITEANCDLGSSVIKGLKESAAKCVGEMLKTKEPLDIINNDIIPALNVVGKNFEEKKAYLPQLLMSAEAATAACNIIKSVMPKSEDSKKCKFVLATVKGDIHDIGKNIVKLLLENYGFDVIDLGKDVPSEKIADAVIKNNAPLVGLSALMTTTVPSMKEAVKLIKEKAPYCKTVVGGAVLTKDYAEKIGADKYSADAMETVRYAEQIAAEKR